MNTIKTKIQELRQTLERWNKRYFIENNPEVSDEEYDKKMTELIALERAHPEFTDPHSPSQKIGATPLKSFRTLEHKIPMLSLGKIYNIKGLELFDARIRKQTKKAEISYTVEEKIDGVSITIRYERGLLKEALTRGDGQTGNDVTENVKTIRSIPLKLTEPRTIEVRGEIFMPKTQFELLRKKQVQKGEKVFANARNATAGSLKLLDSTKTAQRPLDAFFYQIAEGLTEDLPATQHERLQLIHNLGLKTNPHNTRIESLSELIDYIEQFRAKIPQLDYDIDGLVIKVDSIEDQELLGNTAREPKWAIAYKYPSEQKITQILSIELSKSKRGKITPVAKLKKITLSGTDVTRASLHNFEYMKQKDIRVGDWVLIEKKGGIIPQVVRVIKSKRL